MNPVAENALRAVARKCRSEIIKAIDGRPKKEHDRIITSLLDKHAKTVQCLPVSKVIALTEQKPTIWQRTGKGDKTHWVIFLKPEA